MSKTASGQDREPASEAPSGERRYAAEKLQKSVELRSYTGNCDTWNVAYFFLVQLDRVCVFDP